MEIVEGGLSLTLRPKLNDLHRNSIAPPHEEALGLRAQVLAVGVKIVPMHITIL